MRTADLVDRLRRWCHSPYAESAQQLMDEAADEIERLRSQQSVDGQSIGLLLAECQDMQDRCVNGLDGEQWIPVTKQLPPSPGRYVARPDGAMWYYCDFDGEFLPPPGAPPITHWMPDTPASISMRLHALPDRLAQEVRREFDRLRWRDKVHQNIIARIKATLERT